MWKKGQSGFIGKHHTEYSKMAIGLAASQQIITDAHKEAISKAQFGIKEKYPVWNKGLTKETDSRLANKKHPNQSIAMRRIWANASYKERVITKTMASCGIKPNKKEQDLLEILDSAYPGVWKYTGDGSFWIEGKNPDFVNVDGKKQVIELLGCYWHGCKLCFPKRLVKEDVKSRSKTFKRFGYSSLFVWEHELYDIDKVLLKVEGLNK